MTAVGHEGGEDAAASIPGESPARKLALGVLTGIGAVGLAAGALAAGPIFLLTLAAEGLHSHVMARVFPEIYKPAVDHATRDLREKVCELEETVREMQCRLDDLERRA